MIEVEALVVTLQALHSQFPDAVLEKNGVGDLGIYSGPEGEYMGFVDLWRAEVTMRVNGEQLVFSSMPEVQANAKPTGDMLDPDCRSLKHHACSGKGLNEATDSIVQCACECHSKGRASANV